MLEKRVIVINFKPTNKLEVSTLKEENSLMQAKLWFTCKQKLWLLHIFRQWGQAYWEFAQIKNTIRLFVQKWIFNVNLKINYLVIITHELAGLRLSSIERVGWLWKFLDLRYIKKMDTKEYKNILFSLKICLCTNYLTHSKQTKI